MDGSTGRDWGAAVAGWEQAPGEWGAFLDEVLAEPAASYRRPAADHLAQPLGPFLTVARRRWTAPPELWPEVERWLSGRLVALATPTLLAQLAARRGRLRGEDGAARFDDFLRGVRLDDLLGALPVLGRLLATQCLHAVATVTELLDHLATDRAEVVAVLLDGVDPGAVRAVRLGLGDPHGGRGVAEVEFATGARLIHKPRPVTAHARWNELLARVLPELAPARVRLLERPDHGWFEHVPARPCTDPATFYRRAGSLLALLHAVRATDIHRENLIAHGDWPVVVDVETLSHPAWTTPTDLGVDPARAQLDASVLRTAMLPLTRVDADGVQDVSALAGGSGTELCVREVLRSPGTDELRAERVTGPVPPGPNLPRVDGVPVPVERHRQDLADGFRDAYRILVAHGCEPPATPTRLIHRPTRTYLSWLADTTRPEHLGTASARTRRLTELAAATPGPALPPELRDAELRQLFEGDVPLFTAAHDPLPAELGDADLTVQRWIIDATLAARPLPAADSADRAVALATGIADDLLASAFRNADRINWIGLEPADGQQWTVGALGASLADGYTGVALFLAQLGAMTGKAFYLDAAALAVAPLPAITAILARHPELARDVGPDRLTGLGGITFAATRLAALLDRPGLEAAAATAAIATRHAATRQAAAPRPGCPTGDHLGWCTGLAGRVLADPTDTADRFVERLATRPAGSPNHALCHGELGILDAVTELTGRPAELLPTLTARLLDDVERAGPRCGTPNAVPTPGLLSGTAGIGYGLLRLADPDRVPSVLGTKEGN